MPAAAVAATVAGIIWAVIQEGLKQGASMDQIRQAMINHPDIPLEMAEALLKDLTDEMP